MSLPPLTLDDLAFEDLRLLAVRKIPAASGERWTHHAPVDPGVTLLELFAFLLDQQLFMLDQVPETMIRAILGLLGEAPGPTRAARTVVAAPPGTLADFTALATGTALRPASSALEGMVFSAREGTLVPPVESLSVSGDGRSLDSDLRAAAEPVVLNGQGQPGALDISARLAQPFAAAHAGGELALAIVLAKPGVEAEWDARAVDAPPPARFALSWHAGGASGVFDDWRDGTGGLRRSGLIRFAVPADWVGQDEIALRLETPEAGHPGPVRLTGIHLGAAIAEHRREVTIGAADTGDVLHDASRAMLTEQVADWLPISHRRLELPSAYGQVFEDGITVRLEHPRDGWQDWVVAGELGMAASEDRLFTVDRELGRLQFGDGYQGRVPAPAGNIALTAGFGGGVAGNHAPGLEWQLLDSTAALRLVSVVPAEGGEEAESLDAARIRVGGSLEQRHRAVTAEDYEFLVENAAGIAAHRAHVAPGYDPAFPCLFIADSVTVFVVPRTETEVVRPQADDGAIELIRRVLDDARLLTMRVFVMRPRIRPVGVALTISGYGMEDYRATLEPVLRQYLHAALGGPGGAGWPFGAPLRPSELLRVAQEALLRGGRVEKVLIRLLDENRESDCAELQIGEHELVALESLTVRVVEPVHMEAAL